MADIDIAYDIEIVPGDASKDRVFAMTFDNLFIVIIGLAAAMALPHDEVMLRATVLVVVYLGYFFLCEAVIGSTPGKLVFGLWVRRLEGGKCSWQQAAIRTLFRVVEANPLLLGELPAGVAILATKNRQRFGDMLAGTAVRKGRNT